LERALFVVLSLILFTSNIWAGEELLYAIRYESLQRYPDVVNTKIYVLYPDGKESRLIFSDENAPIMLLPRRGMPGHPGEVLVSSKDKLFAHAAEKSLNPGRWYPSKASIYELSLNGTNTFRKILNVEGEQSLSEIFVNPTGTKIGYINYLNQKTFIFIHETEAGKLLHKIDMSKIFLDCFASGIGWLPDGNRLFFTLDTGDVHMTSKESYKKVGTYFIKEDGLDLIKLPQALFSFPEKKGFGPHSSPPQFVGGLLDGTYVFREFKFRKDYRRTEASSLIYLVNPLTKSKKEIPLRVSEGLNWFKVSHTGKYVGFTEKISSKEGRYEWTEHIWDKDLPQGEDNKVFTLDNMPFKGHYLGLIGWIEN
jgi:hypothetical protein